MKLFRNLLRTRAQRFGAVFGAVTAFLYAVSIRNPLIGQFLLSALGGVVVFIVGTGAVLLVLVWIENGDKE